MSNSVTWQDARAVFRLLDELKQLSHEPLAWRRHLLTALSPLVGAQVGLASEVSEGRWPALLNHYLLSHLHVPEYRAVHYVFLFKARSEGPFTERERQIVHHLQGELGELWKAASGARLPRRLQQTLTLLQAGYSGKEVAERLVISPGRSLLQMRAPSSRSIRSFVTTPGLPHTTTWRV
jgi:hypothetical protein